MLKIDLQHFGGRGASSGSRYSQSFLKRKSDSISDMVEMTPNERYELASTFTRSIANENNFFENSVGFWDKKSSPPKRNADYVSYNRRTGKISSRYWYTEKGVYRKSDHWGSDVASCSWYIKGRKYSNTGVQKGNTETAFIAWKDLKAKGMITKHWQTGKYGLSGFKFEK